MTIPHTAASGGHKKNLMPITEQQKKNRQLQQTSM
jgi:hypothetical protein